MKHSIKLRVTLWYACLTLLIVSILLFTLITGVRGASRRYYEQLLTHAMQDAANHVSYHQGVPRLDTEDAADFDKVRFALMDTSGSLWQGRWPPFALPFADGDVRNTEDGGYLVQDLLLPFPQGDLWLRGYAALDPVRYTEHAAVRWALAMGPALALLSVSGGFLLTRHAFRPLKSMVQKADSILSGQNLATRFDVSSSNRRDEFARLAVTFNNMLNRLEDAFRREKQWTDDASHELRTPISAIRAAAEYALDQEDMLEYREALAGILQKAVHMQKLTDQMLEMARMENGRIPLHLEQVDFSLLCRTTAEEMAKNPGVRLRLEGIDAGVTVTGDEMLLMRLLILLLDNAFKYARHQVEVLLSASPAEAVCIIRDDGQGMDSHTRAHAFDRFFQGDSARTENQGAGLGLSMARQIVLMHGGDIAVTSTDHQGAEITVRLPR